MNLEPGVRERIAWQVIAVLVKRFRSFPDETASNRNAPFHEAFLQAFADKLAPHVSDIPLLISLSSWLHGLSTTLGQSFFEKTAQILSGGDKRTFKPNEVKITSAQAQAIDEILSGLKNGTRSPSVTAENQMLLEALEEGTERPGTKFTADVFIEDPMERQIIAVEIKSVRPNAGEMRGEKRKILEAKAALMRIYRGYEIKYFMGFPFDPTSPREEPTGFYKSRFLRHLVEGDKYLDPQEVLLAGEFWDFLSGEQGTMEEILGIINAIATPRFEEEYEFLQNWRNREEHREQYRSILKRWGLVSELRIVDNLEVVCALAESSRRARRLLTQSPFDPEGKYRCERKEALRDLVK